MDTTDEGRQSTPMWLADLVAGVSMAGLLLPEAVAYSGIAGLPPQAGVLGLFAGLVVYGLIGTSRFALVSATSSSAAVLGAATLSIAGPDAALRAALASGLVLLTGLAFVLAGIARLGSICNFISKPVSRGKLATDRENVSSAHDSELVYDIVEGESIHAMMGKS